MRVRKHKYTPQVCVEKAIRETFDHDPARAEQELQALKDHIPTVTAEDLDICVARASTHGGFTLQNDLFLAITQSLNACICLGALEAHEAPRGAALQQGIEIGLQLAKLREEKRKAAQ
jgi:hypothetical protein